MENEAALLHLLFCKRKHFSGPPTSIVYDESVCNWYVEEQVDGAWQAPDHVVWLEKAKRMAELFAEGDKEKLGLLMNKLVSIVSQLNFLLDKNKDLRKLIVMMLVESLSE